MGRHESAAGPDDLQLGLEPDAVGLLVVVDLAGPLRGRPAAVRQAQVAFDVLVENRRVTFGEEFGGNRLLLQQVHPTQQNVVQRFHVVLVIGLLLKYLLLLPTRRPRSVIMCEIGLG